MQVCSLKENVWLSILILSGRRQGDIAKITQSCVTHKENTTFVLLPKDKAHQNSLVSFEFDWTWRLEESVDKYREAFFELLRQEKFPFKSVNVQAVRRKINFKLHALRNYKAICLAIDGFSKENIMSKIGWASEQSLLRYVRVPLAVLYKFENYDDAFAFLTT